MRARDRKGFFISIEKTADGVGGTTNAHLLVENLRKGGYNAFYTREPGGTEFGSKMREILLAPKPKGQELSQAAELFLFHADRAQHYKEVLKPALLEGKIVVCDRYFDSTLVYQGYGRGWKIPTLLRLHQIATGALLPDLTFVLDGTPHRKIPNLDRFETLGDKFFRKVRNGMLRLAESDTRYVLVPANRPIDVVAHDIFSITQERLPSRILSKSI